MHAPRVDVDRLQLPGHTAGRLCSMLRMPLQHEHEHEQSMHWAGSSTRTVRTYARTTGRDDAKARGRGHNDAIGDLQGVWPRRLLRPANLGRVGWQLLIIYRAISSIQSPRSTTGYSYVRTYDRAVLHALELEVR